MVRHGGSKIGSARNADGKASSWSIAHICKRFFLAWTAVLTGLVSMLLLFPVFQVTTDQLAPTLQPGAYVLTVPFGPVETGDFICFSYNTTVQFSRVIGVPGDYVVMDDAGNVVVNGHKLDEPYVTEKGLGACDIAFPYHVPENAYFVLSDQRLTGIDSRNQQFGCVPGEQIIGKVLGAFWPLDCLAWLY